MRSLEVLDLSHNGISSLSGLQRLRVLCSVNLESNLVPWSPPLLLEPPRK